MNKLTLNIVVLSLRHLALALENKSAPGRESLINATPLALRDHAEVIALQMAKASCEKPSHAEPSIEFMEVMYDITTEVAIYEERLTEECLWGNSRDRFAAILVWAREFDRTYRQPFGVGNYFNTCCMDDNSSDHACRKCMDADDYLICVDDFTKRKLDAMPRINDSIQPVVEAVLMSATSEDLTLVRVWVSDQPGTTDATVDYLKVAGIEYKGEIHYPISYMDPEKQQAMSRALIPWGRFMRARELVARVAHGNDPNGNQIIERQPDLVACMPDASGEAEETQRQNSRLGISPVLRLSATYNDKKQVN